LHWLLNAGTNLTDGWILEGMISMSRRYAVISGFLGATRDRFCVYGENRSIEEKFKVASEIEGVTGIELVVPYDCPDTALIKELCEKYDLQIASINLNLKGEPEFYSGSYTSPDAAIRKKAMEFTEQAFQIADELGVGLITMCPLADGHDYSFQTDYSTDWKHMRDCVKEAARINPRIKYSLEYKPTEPRVHCYLDTAATTLLLCEEVGEDNVGVTLDIGHALCAGETPAKALALLAERDRLFYIHINDNNRAWDWDLIPGSVHLWDMVEFLVYMKKYKYDNWVTADMMPARVDVKKGFAQTFKVWSKFETLAERCDLEELVKLSREGDATDAFEYLWNLL